MNSVNDVTLLGNLGDNPEVRKTKNGKSVVFFSLATNKYFKNEAGEQVSITNWHRVVLFNRLADLGEESLVKGKQVLIKGSLYSRNFKDKDGKTVYITEVRAHEMILLGTGKNDSRKSFNSPREENSTEYIKNITDETFNLEGYID